MVYDVVVFGASGYTGQYVVETLAKFAVIDGVTWTIAGRSRQKLLETLATVSKWLAIPGRDLAAEVEANIITADSDDAESLNAMCRQARVVINCVGPQKLYGEQLVKACIENGAHYVDISGEELFMANMQLKYNEKARDAKVCIVSGCGYDSLPAELAVDFLQEAAKKNGLVLKSVDLFMKPLGPQGQLNFGTLNSAMLNEVDKAETARAYEQIFEPTPDFPRLSGEKDSKIFYSDAARAWCCFQHTSDITINERTQLYKFRNQPDKPAPASLSTYFSFDSYMQSIGINIGYSFIQWVASSQRGLRYLLKYPEVMTGGVFTRAGPKREVVVRRSFETYLDGRCYDGSKVAAKLVGPDMAYVTCSACVVESAIVLVKEKERLPADGGGVYTPGAVFAKTTLRERLEKHGLKYEMLPTV